MCIAVADLLTFGVIFAEVTVFTTSTLRYSGVCCSVLNIPCAFYSNSQQNGLNSLPVAFIRSSDRSWPAGSLGAGLYTVK